MCETQGNTASHGETAVTRFTIRFEENHVVASDDSGNSFDVPQAVVDKLSHFWSTRSRGIETTLSAAALASIAEARNARPMIPSETPNWLSRPEGRRINAAHNRTRSSHRFTEILDHRVSVRQFSAPSFDDLAILMVRCHRVLDFRLTPDGYLATHRPAPSAGGRHPIELHLLASNVKGLASGHYQFDPLTCELIETDEDWKDGLRRIRDVLGIKGGVPAAIVPVAHLDRTLSRYPAGLSLVWRDSGALLNLAHLCAIDLGLVSCIVGTAATLVSSNEPKVIDVGSLAVGCPVSGEQPQTDDVETDHQRI
jgi:SagB-type dehydrogenase family enzyme